MQLQTTMCVAQVPQAARCATGAWRIYHGCKHLTAHSNLKSTIRLRSCTIQIRKCSLQLPRPDEGVDHGVESYDAGLVNVLYQFYCCWLFP